jgi:hypothetical protein
VAEVLGDHPIRDPAPQDERKRRTEEKGTTMTQQMWGPALEAEIAYRREMVAKAYRKGAPRAHRTVRAWRRARAWAARMHEERSGLAATRTRDAEARAGDSLDTVGARTDATPWRRDSGRSIRFEYALEALRPHEGVGRHAA